MSKTFKQTFYSFINNELMKREYLKNLTIMSAGGTPLIRRGEEFYSDEALEGGFLAAITFFVRTHFETELNQVRLEGNSIIIKCSQHFIVYVIFDVSDKVDDTEVEEVLCELLSYLERCPEIEHSIGYIAPAKVKYLVKQYINSIC